MDGFNEIGRYLRHSKRQGELSLKREVTPQISVERIRDIFDSEHPVKGDVVIPPAMRRVMMDLNFGQKLPSLACCGDCMCGQTESYTSDSLVSGSIYVTQPYVPGSTVVYLNGTQATKGIDYVEANPDTGQIAILTDSSTIIVSYVYTVGNCTEAICFDGRFECLPYTIIAGLTTVFSDRFDRSEGPIPSGGCGSYFLSNIPTFPPTSPSIFDGIGSFSTGNAFWVGGTDRLIGKSVEILAAVNIDEMSTGGLGNSFVLRQGPDFSSSFTFIKTSSTVLTLRINALLRIYTFFDDPFSFIDLRPVDEASGFNVEIPITHIGGRYWIRMAQGSGFWAMKAWPQFETEPAVQLTAQLSDSYADVPADVDEVNRELIQPTANFIGIRGGGYEAIQVGAGLDNGDLDEHSLTQGADGHYCAEIPDARVRFGYNCFPANGVSTITTVAADSPFVQWIASWPHPNLESPQGTTENAGRIVELLERVADWSCLDGHPGGFRVRGQMVGAIWDEPVTVQIKQYGTGPLTMGGINGVQGGNVVASYLVPNDGTIVEVDFFLSGGGDDFIRWGLHVENLASFIEQQPFYSGPFLFPNNYTNIIKFYNIQVDGVQSVNCTTGPFCNDCTDFRCPTVQDGFTLDNATQDFGTTDFNRLPDNGGNMFFDKGTGSKVEFIGNIMKYSFNTSNSSAFVSGQYDSPFDCSYTGDVNAYEATFEVKLGAPAAGEFGAFEFGGWDGGPYIRIFTNSTGIDSVGSFNISPSYSSTNITLGSWYNVRYQVVNGVFNLKIWLSGTTEPTDWTFTSTATAPTNTFALYGDTSGAGNSATVEFRNVNISRLGVIS